MAQSNDIRFTRNYRNREPEVLDVHFSRYPKDNVLAAMAKAMLEDGGISVSVDTKAGAFVLMVEK